MSLIIPVKPAFCSAPKAKGLDPGRRMSQYGHSAWRIQDGYLSGVPFAIAQTTDGYLWIGTESGLQRFHGVRLVSWAPPGRTRLEQTVRSTKRFGLADRHGRSDPDLDGARQAALLLILT